MRKINSSICNKWISNNNNINFKLLNQSLIITFLIKVTTPNHKDLAYLQNLHNLLIHSNNNSNKNNIINILGMSRLLINSKVHKFNMGIWHLLKLHNKIWWEDKVSGVKQAPDLMEFLNRWEMQTNNYLLLRPNNSFILKFPILKIMLIQIWW